MKAVLQSQDTKMKLPVKKKAVKKKAIARSIPASKTPEFWDTVANDPNKSNAQRDRARNVASMLRKAQ